MSRARALLALGFAVAFMTADRAHGEDQAVPGRITVQNEAGRPLAGAQLLATRGALLERQVFDAAAQARATSDARGEIDTTGRDVPQARRYCIVAPGYAPALVPAGPAGAHLRLLPARVTRGRVRVSGAKSAAPHELLAVPESRHADLIHAVRADASGAYVFDRLHAGAWRVFLAAPGRAPRPIARVVAGDVVPETRVGEPAGLRGTLLDADGTHGRPAPGVALALVPLQGSGEGRVAFRTDDAGAFHLENVEPGVYDVVIDDATWAFEPAPPRVQVDAGRERDLAAWFAVHTWAVTGRVVDEDDRPLHGVQLRLVPEPGRPLPPGAEAAGVDGGPSDPSGRFRVPAVAPGEGYRLLAHREGRSPFLSAPFTVRRGKDTEVRPVRMRRGWRVAVRVRNARGVGVVGARVIATAAQRPDAPDDPLFELTVRRGTTDAEGRLELVDLPADDVLLRVVAADHLPMTQRVEYPRVDDLRNADIVLQPAARLEGRLLVEPGGAQGPFSVVARRRDGGARDLEAVVRADFGFVLTDLQDSAYDLRVVRHRLGGSDVLARVENVLPGAEEHLEIPLPLLHRLRGTVVGLAASVTHVTVVAESPVYDARRERALWTAVAEVRVPTQLAGTPFELADLPPGLYALRAVVEALDTDTILVRLHEGDLEGLELVMPAGARLAAAVRDEQSRPILGARVRLLRMHGEDPAPVRGGAPLEVITDERGDFVAEGLAPGLWRVEATDRERAPALEIVRLRDGEVLVLDDLVLGDGGAIQGRVEDANGRPLDGVHVQVRPFDDVGQVRHERTDAEGMFRARLLAPGAYLVAVSAETVAGGPWVEAAVEVVANETAEVAFVTGEDGSIGGTVLRRGERVAGAVVDLVHEPLEAGAALRRYRTTTGADGRFFVGGLDAGRYTLQLQSGAYRTTHTVELQSADALDLDLEAFEARLRGVVVTRDDQPVSGAEITAIPLDESGRPWPDPGFLAEGRSDARGQFLLSGLPPGPYVVTVSAPGLPPGRYAPATADLPGADFAFEVVLGRGGDLELSVRDENGRGLTGASVWLEDESGVALHRRAYVTGAAGRLLIEGVASGAVRVRVHARGYGRPARQRVLVEEGSVHPVALTLRPGGAVRLVVTSHGENPVARTRIDVLRASDREVLVSRRPLGPLRGGRGDQWASPSGVVTIGDLEAGAYIARIEAGRTLEPAEVPFVVAAGQQSELRVTLQGR
ncbi:MAG: carboxypeptidase regulatory-like domain-containing protein [Planctomycetota bacterium]|nr:carboxypeptidase regulatory-like domain-containing protein [Planctomycetota bacterium]